MFYGDTDRLRFPLAIADLLVVYNFHGVIFWHR